MRIGPLCTQSFWLFIILLFAKTNFISALFEALFSSSLSFPRSSSLGLLFSVWFVGGLRLDMMHSIHSSIVLVY
jgi:hypothetical protein